MRRSYSVSESQDDMQDKVLLIPANYDAQFMCDPFKSSENGLIMKKY